MPNLHDSVTQCKRCDWIVAVCETQPCAECGTTVCIGCAKPTKDPDLSVCSWACRAEVNKRIVVQEAAKQAAARAQFDEGVAVTERLQGIPEAEIASSAAKRWDNGASIHA